MQWAHREVMSRKRDGTGVVVPRVLLLLGPRVGPRVGQRVSQRVGPRVSQTLYW